MVGFTNMMAYLMLAFIGVSKTFDLPPGLLSSICYVESRHKVSAMNLNDGGSKSVGICQIKRTTAELLGFRGTDAELKEPRTNIYYAGKYIRQQLDRYDNNIPVAIAAYNSGTYIPGHGGGAVNRSYVKQVMDAWQQGR